MKFINELGNEIEIKVNWQKSKSIDSPDFVDISIIGPNSSITSNLTLQEARILRDVLSDEL